VNATVDRMNEDPLTTAETYARWRASTLGKITERVETDLVFMLAGRLAGKRVLDVGTGDGTYAVEAAARGAIVTGLDSEQEMLEAAARRAAQRQICLTLRRASAARLPFDAGSFDVVLAVTVLCFVPDALPAVREMARVLVPRGRCVLGDLARFSIWAAERRLRGWCGAQPWRRAHFWSRRELVRLAQAAGLQLDCVRGAVFFPPIGAVARAVSPIDPLLTRLRAPGAAFLVLAADKPRV
jgi:ubiquinone/menaquinone biosynthesis C-methylase UbiE